MPCWAPSAPPSLWRAGKNPGFPPIPADKQTAKEKEFIKALTESPRSANGGGGNINNPPFKVYLRSPEFGIEAIKMSDYLRLGTGLEDIGSAPWMVSAELYLVDVSI